MSLTIDGLRPGPETDFAQAMANDMVKNFDPARQNVIMRTLLDILRGERLLRITALEKEIKALNDSIECLPNTDSSI